MKFLLAIIAAAAIAFVMNKYVLKKIDKSNIKILLQISAYLVLAVLFLLFLTIFNLRSFANSFADSQIARLETYIYGVSKISLDEEIPVAQAKAVLQEASQSIDNAALTFENNFGVAGKTVSKIISSKFLTYIGMAESYISEIENFSTGKVSIKNLLMFIKQKILNSVEPILKILLAVLLITLLFYLGIYFVFAYMLRKKYKPAILKSGITFGESTEATRK